ncbi:MAG TPA: hypothetical protein VHO25_04805 [Polyangiaceae bacterium]|nr:hypothetical protein [Polyangiaceae bacterium]
MLLIQRDAVAEMQRQAFTLIQVQRYLIELGRECREAAAAWRQCLELAERHGVLEIVRIAKAQLQLREDAASRCWSNVVAHSGGVERLTETVRGMTADFYQRRTEFLSYGDDVRDIELPNSEAELAATTTIVSGLLDNETLPTDRAQQFVQQLQAQAPALS